MRWHFRAPWKVDTAPTGPDTGKNRVRHKPPTQGTGRMVGVEVLLKWESQMSLVMTKCQKMLDGSRYRVKVRSWWRALPRV